MAATSQQCLEGQVILVTGAGRGIGRDAALLAAAQGARVVVNDLGSAVDGSSADRSPAEQVVAEIRAGGGEAVSSGDSVASAREAERIVTTALDSYGRLDAVVNNAGILRDREFDEMDPADFDAVVQVHLHGSFYVSRAAAPHLRRQGRGAYVHVTSSSALVGNHRQANYASAKMGLVGLSRSIALDMAQHGVRSNCVVPFAWSRMMGAVPETATGAGDRAWWIDRLRAVGPDTVAPLIVFLASGLSDGISGQILGVRKNEVYLFSQPRPIRTVHRAGGWTPQDLAEQMRPAFAPSFTPLERSADVFAWDPI
ncbi:MAG TPA: SDR family NAD(P)-dependent oxidoreductase [Candidatus Dormibacteraeota bacterium]|jgi:NAD(P)-dependent dehydrogenase (short-subunit alcohol dehydrogenase family)|nr:SDR family NAD(P)-dependent oxidoreductase [Candidatus Dormibacteraeota bacterium]